MIGDMVVNTSRSGTRLILIRLRLATIGAVGERLAARRCARSGATGLRLGNGGHRSPPRARLRRSDCSQPLVLGAVAGEGEEHVVERRAAQRDVVQCDAGRVEVAQRLGQHGGAAGDRGGEPAGVLVDLDRAALGQLRRAPRARAGMSLAAGDHDLDPLAADLGLELVGRALGDRRGRGR